MGQARSIAAAGTSPPVISNQPESPLRPYALCGVIAPIFFALMVIMEGLLVPGYSQVSQPISDLGAYALYGSKALFQNLNFWVFGLLVVSFAIGLKHELPASRAITASMGVFGAMIFLAGVFPDEPSPWPAGAHGLVSIAAFVSIILSQFFAWRRLRRPVGDEGAHWVHYGRISLVTMVLSIIMFVLYGAFGQPGSLIGGLVQRMFLVVPWLWIEIMSLRLLRLSKRWSQGVGDKDSDLNRF